VSLSLLDWRRAVFSLYGDVRREPDPRAAHDRWCAGRNQLMRTHPDSPIPPAEREPFGGLDVAPYDPSLRWEVEVETDVEQRRLAVETGTDGVVPFRRIGVVRLGDIGTLDVWWLESYGGGVFVPLKDATAGSTTYGGGRYLLDTVKGADLGGTDGRLVIDLNFAYNPSCAYDPAWACPLAPPGNTLPGAVHAGELLPRTD
jgi:uncharacterized protein (DUF1684 family)